MVVALSIVRPLLSQHIPCSKELPFPDEAKKEDPGHPELDGPTERTEQPANEVKNSEQQSQLQENRGSLLPQEIPKHG